jgi:hypothetical protein
VVSIEIATGTFSVSTISVYHSFSFFRRSANFAALLPYGVGNFQGDVLGKGREEYRSGLLDTGFRIAMNLRVALRYPYRSSANGSKKSC